MDIETLISSIPQLAIKQESITRLLEVGNMLAKYGMPEAACYTLMAVAELSPESPMPEDLLQFLRDYGHTPKNPVVTPDVLAELLARECEEGCHVEQRDWRAMNPRAQQQNAPAPDTQQ